MTDDETIVSGLHQVAVAAADLDQATAFYRDRLGLPLVARFDPPGLAFFQLGSLRLLVEKSEAATPGSSVLYLRVAEIHEACRRLSEKGVVFTGEPQLIHRDDTGTFGARGVEEWMAFFNDPDGNILALTSRVAPTSGA